jgi:hypothetical protein
MSLRPGGVTGIAVLFLIAAAAFLIVSVICLIEMGALAVSIWQNNIEGLIEGIPFIGPFYIDHLADNLANPTTWVIAGVIFIGIGAADILTFLGLLKLKKWGYWLCIIISIPLIVVIVGIIFIWYLRKDEVKAAFDIK